MTCGVTNRASADAVVLETPAASAIFQTRRKLLIMYRYVADSRYPHKWQIFSGGEWVWTPYANVLVLMVHNGVKDRAKAIRYLRAHPFPFAKTQ